MIVHVIGIQIAAGFLGGDDIIDEFLRHGANRWTITGLQSEASGLGPFVNVGIGINRAALSTFAFIKEAAKIGHAAVGLEQIVHSGNAVGEVGFAPLTPKTASDGYGVHGNVAQLCVR